ncbi:DUF4215 domain-containing protein [Nannocystis sp. SCPEA4]|uniref:RCC1 domain-containing protein n=1 Tax=Nannocystis sp. SCPEA4 TaxID=2996787 RepID=UPI00226FCF6B|nr:DUF4215 domain-containing protein [Nannocystis sp. SCPEA4]MCY1056809.1 DUF4215 domain-containing protein [Nannocystis sp. SCPEA4]
MQSSKRPFAWLPALFSGATFMLAACSDDTSSATQDDPDTSSTSASSTSESSTGEPEPTTGAPTTTSTTTGSTTEPEPTTTSVSTSTTEPDSTSTSTSTTEPDSTSSSTGPGPGCGDSAIDDGETCDDGNTDVGDGCDAACGQESGFECVGEPSVCTTICGDGLVVGGETCDDGNTDVGDGCDALCAPEPGFECVGEPSVCVATCGDGITAGGETCDDGNTDAGDGCDALCATEPGWSCAGAPSVCTPACGDGLVLPGFEDCDDGNMMAGDGCSDACEVEVGWECSGEPSACVTTCNDGVVAGTEACDDGNIATGDGCSPLCLVDYGWGCSGSPSVCNENAELAAVALGGFGGCVLTTTGDVACFGRNTSGEVGNGTTNVETHMPALALTGAVAVTAGEEHHCAIRAAGDVWCWGDNLDSQLGPLAPAPGDKSQPVEVTGMPAAAAIDAGDDHTCVLDTAGLVWCWGDNNQRQLGHGGNDVVDDATPTAVTMPGGLAAVDLGLGDDHSCAVLVDGSVACWGDDALGQLGDGVAGTDSGSATLVPGLEGMVFVDVEGGQFDTCATTNLGELYCWGQNADGQLGDGTTINSATPLPVALPAEVDAISLGDDFACALLVTDEVLCWGEAEDFQAGTRDLIDQLTPFPVPELPAGDIEGIEAGARGVCIVAVGERYCWGYSDLGNLGIAPQNELEPAPVGFSGPVAELALDRSEYRGVLCGVLVDGTVECSGQGTLVSNSAVTGAAGYFEPISYHLTVPTQLPALANVQTMGMGDGFACAATLDDVQCWGDNSQRQLGQGGVDTTDILIPTAVVGLGAVDELELGAGNACVRTGGNVQCWGDNAQFQTGEGGTTDDQSAPVTVVGLSDAVDLALGLNHACAVRATGEVVCWGDDSQGGLGDGDNNPDDSALPVAVTGVAPGATAVVAGENHACALAGGQVYCWGNGQALGQGVDVDSDTALLVPGVASIVQIDAGWNYNCARDDAGDVWCWGYSLDGQLGDGGQLLTGNTYSLSPVKFAVASEISRVVAGNSLTCIETAGEWSCVGFRATGQLGNGTTVEPVVPTPTFFGL